MKSLNVSFVYFVCLVSAMGGLLFGYDWVVIGGAKPFYEIYFGIAGSSMMQAIAMSIALLGCLVGAMTAGLLADRYGRKRLLLGAAFVFFISSLATGTSDNFISFVIARFVGGIAIGLAADLSPMYIAEIAPSAIRGKLVTFNQLTIVIGILGAQIVNMLIAEPVPENTSADMLLSTWNAQMGWRWMFWAVCVPSSCFFLLSLFIPESPRWLYAKGRKKETRSILTAVGGEKYAEEEMKNYQQALSNSVSDEGKFSSLFASGLNKIIVIGIVIAAFQQWCGINVIFNYAQEIFDSAGYGISDMLMNIVVTGISNLVFTFVAIFTVEKVGRKSLMLIGALGLTFIYVILGMCYFFHSAGVAMIVLVVLAIGFYAMSIGPITWVLLSEIFPNHLRSRAMALCTAVLWMASFTLTYTFPFLNSGLGTGGTFMLYALICLFGSIFTLKYIPETKGKSLEQLESELMNN